MTRLYRWFDGSLEELAHRIGELALPQFRSELRDGLNLGGGDCIKFAGDGFEVLLVCNDADYAGVFVPERAEFPFYCYVWKGDEILLEGMVSALGEAGIACEIDEDA